MAKIKTAAVKTEKKTAGFMTAAAGIWMVVMTAVFPLYFQDAYADMLDAKYSFMLIADGLLLGAFIVWAATEGRFKKYIASMKSYADPETGRWFGGWFKHTFNILDIFILAFLAIVLISTLLAYPYVYQAFFGNEGRWVGTITLVLWCLTFFAASRHFRFRPGYIYAFLACTLAVTLWAVTDYFDMDILNFKRGIGTDTYAIFVSTIGNIDTYAGFASIPMAFAGCLFVLSKKGLFSRFFFWICFAAAILSMTTCSADNAYLSIAVFLALLPFGISVRAGIRRYLIVLATVLTAVKLTGYWDTVYADTVMVTHNGLVDICAGKPFLWWAAAALWIIAALLFVYDVIIRKYPDSTPAPRAARTVWTVIVIAAVSAVLVLFIYANTHASSLPQFLEPLKSYLVFSDEWGTWRGYVWKRIMDIYTELPFVHKLFGTGPETVSIYLYNDAYFDIAGTTGMMYDSAHNEWLAMFFNLGSLGLISYLCTFIAPVVMAFRRNVRKYFPVALAVGLVCACHLAESFINISALMELPTVFALMAMAQSLFRSED